MNSNSEIFHVNNELNVEVKTEDLRKQILLTVANAVGVKEVLI
jgi:hypothetical protein